jgi:hypothetical protein
MCLFLWLEVRELEWDPHQNPKEGEEQVLYEAGEPGTRIRRKRILVTTE